MRIALVWLRRDLRLADNPALRAAAQAAETVLPVYVHAPDEEAPWAPGAASNWWLHQSLAALDAALRQRGGALVLRRGPSLQCLRDLLTETGAGAVFWNRLHEPAIRKRDAGIEQALRKDGVEVESHEGALMFEPAALRTGAGAPYRVFTPFWRAAQSHFPLREPVPVPRRLAFPSTVPDGVPLGSLGLQPAHGWGNKLGTAWTPGEAGAQAALDRFCDEALPDYATGRDRPALAGTARLSPHLHFGEISPVQVAARVQQMQASRSGPGWAGGSEVFLKELGWREFAHHVLVHFPHTPQQPMDSRFAKFPWRRAGAELRRWQQGETGIPIVDAGMRELWATGWMHNRVRMIAASLLTKNLLLPWQEGARWFWDTLVDADLANNTLGWQWVSGCGADAAPYFRIFNPVLQSRKFDAGGGYLRRWLPELAALDDKAIHAPWTAPQPPRNYPPPVVDLKQSRERALAAFQRLKAKG